VARSTAGVAVRAVTGWALALLVVAALAAPAGAQPAGDLARPGSLAACADPGLLARLSAHQRQRHHLEAHLLAETLVLLCPAAPEAARWQIVDALALLELDETVRGQELLFGLATGPATAPPDRDTARLLLSWSYLRLDDQAAFATTAAELAPPDRARVEGLALARDPVAFAAVAARLPMELQAEARAEARRLQEARRTRRPWLAGVLSAVVPGLGQAYAGSWQGAAIALFLNGALIGATAELAHRRLYLAATASGVAASFFYFGNVLNAADLARRRNETAAFPHARALEQLLLPEALPPP
jgi:hypothetical protein